MAATHSRSKSGLSERLLRLSQPRNPNSAMPHIYGFLDQVHKEKLFRENRFYASVSHSRPHAETPQPQRLSEPDSSPYRAASRLEGPDVPLRGRVRSGDESDRSFRSGDAFAYVRVDKQVSRSPRINPLTGELTDHFSLFTNKSLSSSPDRPKVPYRLPSLNTSPMRPFHKAQEAATKSYWNNVHPLFPGGINPLPIRKGMGYRLTTGLLS